LLARVFEARALKCLAIALLLPSWPQAGTQELSNKLQTIKTVREIFKQSRAETAKGHPIELEGIVTYSDPEWGLLFIQDSTGPTYIDVHGNPTAFVPGQRVRVRAVSMAGPNGPAIERARVTVIGHAGLPKAKPMSVAELDAGGADSHVAITEGVLRPCDAVQTRICFQVYDGPKRIWLVIPHLADPASRALIGARVRATGVAARHEDSAEKRLGGELFVQSVKNIDVLDPPPAISSSTPPSASVAVRSSDADARFVRQVHIRGTVVWASPGLFAVQDGSGTIFAGPEPGEQAQTGTAVDVIGFPSHGVFGMEIANAAVTVAGAEKPAIRTPISICAGDILRRSLQGKRVRVKARLVAQSADTTQFAYQLQDGGQRFNAVLLRSGARGDIVRLARDSVIELTGVAFIQRGNAAWPDALLILVESPADIAVVSGGGWLTPQRTLAMLALMAVCVAIPLVWVTMLRRTVRRQTAVIRARLESEMHLETRFRVLFERNLAAVFTWRPDGTIIDCNMAFVRMLGFSTCEKTIGRNYWELEADAAQRERLRGRLNGEALSNLEASLRRDDGAMVYLLENITPVHTAEGEVYETTAIDVTLLKQNQTELKKARDAALRESLIDSLTGLPNRRCLMDKLASSIQKARSEGHFAALLYLDLDGFKLVNDSLGHPVGDELLVQVGACLRSWIRADDTLARLGGDEFMVLLNGLSTKQDAMLVAENLLDVIANPFHVKGHELAIGASIGISVFPDDSSQAEELMQQADSAMYAAKRAGRNRAAWFTPEMGFEVHERSTLENLLRGAAARKEIFVHYQPEWDLKTNRLVRFEALARWTHPTIGEIPPLKFIPIAEESGIIGPLGAYIMEQACVEAVRWQSIALHPIQLGVNVSGMQLRRKGFVEEVRQILARSGLGPELLEIEVTESTMLDEGQYAVGLLAELKNMGIGLAIDDFGTGYSNLSYLPSLPFSALKIDGKFIRDLDVKPESPAMVRTLITLAHDVGMRVIVEGVETAEQLELVKTLGANEVQGFLLGRPAPNPVEAFVLPAVCAK